MNEMSTNLTPDSPNKLGLTLGFCPKTFKRRFSGDALKLKSKLQKWRESQYSEKIQELAIKILSAIDKLTSQGRDVSNRQLSMMVGIDRNDHRYVAARNLTLQ